MLMGSLWSPVNIFIPSDVKVVCCQPCHWSNYRRKYNVEVQVQFFKPLPVLHFREKNLRCPTLVYINNNFILDNKVFTIYSSTLYERYSD